MAEVMYFGKYKGSPLEDVPTDYLFWCATNIRKCPMPVIAELDRRLGGAALPKTRSVRKYLKRKSGVSHIKSRTVVGANFHRMMREFESAGLNTGNCPFDVPEEGYRYSGPTIRIRMATLLSLAWCPPEQGRF